VAQGTTRIEFTPTTADTIQPDTSESFGPATKRIPVEVRVTTAAGAPLPDRTVHLVLQFGACTRQCLAGEADTGRSWFGFWQADPVTDESGIVRAELPVAFPAWPQNTPSPGKVRLVATLDGGPDERPLHVAKVLAIG
jgi:hypothetical protein